jgi:flagellar assembly protein FliH
MMNTSFNEIEKYTIQVPVSSFLYRDMDAAVLPHPREATQEKLESERANESRETPPLSPKDINDLVEFARAEAVATTERRLLHGYEEKSAKEAAGIQRALELFLVERKNYFSRIESEVVHLALAISAKILHRQAQVDPMLVAALVRVAVDKLHDGSSVSVRVSPLQAEKWREYLADPLNGSKIAIVEDAHLGPEDCILETDLGSANFSIEAQLKEVEQGFFDLLAQRPLVK